MSGEDAPPTDEPQEEPPALGDFVERSLSRLLVEAVLGALVGGALGALFEGGALGLPEAAVPGRQAFAVAGVVVAPITLLLTPRRGPLLYRALRYGVALAVLATLLLSFGLGADEVPVEALILFGAVFLAVGAAAHGVFARPLDRLDRPDPSGSSDP